jgi:hypothetical protein
MPAELLAVGTTAADSADVFVDSGSQLTVALKDAAGSLVDSTCVVQVMLKDDDGAYFRIGQLSAAQPSMVLSAGVYRFTRAAGAACGVFGASSDWTYYFAYSTGYTAYATPTDLLELVCPAGKKIEVIGAHIVANATAATLVNVLAILRSAANTGGTSSNLTIGKYDTLHDNSTATVKLYTAAPVLGATAVNLAQFRNSITASTSVPTTMVLESAAGALDQMPNYPFFPTLNAGQSFVWNFAGAALPAGFDAQIGVNWRERAV